MENIPRYRPLGEIYAESSWNNNQRNVLTWRPQEYGQQGPWRWQRDHFVQSAGSDHSLCTLKNSAVTFLFLLSICQRWWEELSWQGRRQGTTPRWHEHGLSGGRYHPNTRDQRGTHTACTSTSFEIWRSKCQLVKAVSSNTQKEISLMSQGSIQISEFKTVIRPDMILHLKPWRSCFHRAAAVVFAQVHKLELSRVLHTGFMPPCRPRRGNTQHSLTSTAASKIIKTWVH